MNRIAIVGFGGAGYNAARAARAHDPQAQIDVYTDTGTAPYNPMLTTYYVKGSIGYEQLFPFGSLEDIRRELDLRIHTETTVTGLRPDDRTLILSDGTQASYDNILISTGAAAFVPRVAGIDLPGVFKMRTAQDAGALKARLDEGRIKTGLVIGASWVGIKIVEDFRDREIETTLIDGAGWIFPVAAFPQTAERIHADLQRKGVALSFRQMLEHIEREEDGRLTAVMQNGSRFTADTIAVCIGVRPNTFFLKDSGLQLNRGVLVDEQLRTSAAGIYAAGDCCEAAEVQTGQHKNIGVWMNAQRQGAVAGCNMAGGSARFGGNLLLNLAHYMDYDFVSIGDVSTCCESDEWYEYEDARYYLRGARSGKKLKCVNMIGTAESNGIFKNLLIKLSENPSTGIDIASVCYLRDRGFPADFIKFMGGTTVD